MDREKLIKHFEHLLNAAKGNYQDFVDLTVDAGEEILSLLKEQEAVEPDIVASTSGYWYTCGSCGFGLCEVRDTVYFDDRKQIRYCASCGRVVKWNG